jgi:hypothetical protein
MEIWPAELQQKLNANSFQVTFGDTLVRSENAAGATKVRSRFTDGIDQYRCSITLDISEYSVLSVFFKTSLNNGADKFIFEDPLTESPGVFRFAGPPVITPIGGRVFTVSMAWDKFPS